MKPTTQAGRLLLMAGLTFHSGRRLADHPELLAAIEAEARAPLEAEIARLRAVQAIVDEQAEDEGLWFIAATCPEAYLQQELRRLHAAIEEVIVNPGEAG